MGNGVWIPAFAGMTSWGAGMTSWGAGMTIVVGAIGFEPTTPCSQSRCATRLRHAPTLGQHTPAERFAQGVARASPLAQADARHLSPPHLRRVDSGDYRISHPVNRHENYGPSATVASRGDRAEPLSRYDRKRIS